jgi:hypothetical protein
MAKFSSQGTSYGGGYNKWAALGSSLGEGIQEGFKRAEEQRAKERQYKHQLEQAAVSSGQLTPVEAGTEGAFLASDGQTWLKQVTGEEQVQKEYDTWHDNFEKAATSRFGSPQDAVEPEEISRRIQMIDQFVNDNMFRKFGADGVLNPHALSPDMMPAYVEDANKYMDPTDPDRNVVGYITQDGKEVPIITTQGNWDKYTKESSSASGKKKNPLDYLLGNNPVKPRTGYEQAAQWAGGAQKALGGLAAAGVGLKGAGKALKAAGDFSKAQAIAQAAGRPTAEVLSKGKAVAQAQALKQVLAGGATVAPHTTLGSAAAGAVGPALLGQLGGYATAFGIEGAQNVVDKMDPGSPWGRDAATRNMQALINWEKPKIGQRNVPALGAGAMEVLLANPQLLNKLNVPMSEVPYEYRDKFGVR